MKTIKTLAILGLVILFGIGCYIAGAYQAEIRCAKLTTYYNIMFDQAYLDILDTGEDKIRTMLERNISMFYGFAEKTDAKISFKNITILFSKTPLEKKEFKDQCALLLEYALSHPNNSLKKEAIDFAKSKQ